MWDKDYKGPVINYYRGGGEDKFYPYERVSGNSFSHAEGGHR